MSSREVEVEWDYVPSIDSEREAQRRAGRRGFGAVLELALQTSGMGGESSSLKNVRFITPLALAQASTVRARIDASGRIRVTSTPVERDEPESLHLTATVGAHEQAVLDRIVARCVTAEVSRDLTPEERASIAGDVLGRITLLADGVAAEIGLELSGAELFQFHPTLLDAVLALAGVYSELRTGASLVTAGAESVHVLQPGAGVRSLRLLELSRDRDGATLALVALADGGVAAYVDGLFLARPSTESGVTPVPPPSALSHIVERELADRLAKTPSAARRSVCERYLVELARVVLGDAVLDLSVETPFRDLGLGSRHVATIAVSLSKALAEEVPVTRFYECPTIAALATALAHGSSAPRAARSAQAPMPSAVREPIAVIGIGCRMPGGADTPAAFWSLLRTGKHVPAPITPEREQLTPGLTYPFAALEHIEQFDAAFFGIAEAEACAMDPQHRIVLEVTWQALEHAGIVPASLNESRTGVFVGSSVFGYASLRREVDAYLALGNEPSAVAGRISYFLGLRGPSMCIDTACSSSLVAVCSAADSLRSGQIDLAIVAGVNLVLDPRVTSSLAALGVLSPHGRCATFDAGADGYVRGEGCGVVILRRLSDAREKIERVHAVIPGYAVGHGGRSNGLVGPNRAAQVALQRDALRDAGLDAARVEYVEAHGAGTPLGDAVELEAIVETYGNQAERRGPVLAGSVKTNFGHLEAAAGITGLIKAILAVEHGELPRHLHLQSPCATLVRHASSIRTCESNLEWRSESPRVAAVNAFGMSGTYAHVLVERAVELTRAEPRDGLCLLPLTARTEHAVRKLARAYRAHLNEGGNSRDLAFTAAHHRQTFNVRACVVAEGTAELGTALDAVARGELPIQRSRSERPRIAFLYSGQGAQYAGMGRRLFEEEPVFRAAMLECDELLRPLIGRSMSELLYSVPAEANALQVTELAQPALFCIQYALSLTWRSWGVEPDYVLGHSLGEYAAACIAGVFSLERALRLVVARGRLIGSLPSDGAMAVVEAGATLVDEWLHAHPDVTIAAFNSPNQVVVSGPAAAVDALLPDVEARGVRVRRLQLDQAFHSRATDPILDEFEAAAREAGGGVPNRPLVSTVTGGIVTRELERARYWSEQVRLPVQFARAMDTLWRLGVDACIEIGPHPVLLSPANACIEDCNLIASLRRDVDGLRQMLSAAGELFAAGVAIDWTSLPGAREGALDAIPTYPFEHREYWFARARGDRPGSGAVDVIDEDLRAMLIRSDHARRVEHLRDYVRGEIRRLLPSDRPQMSDDATFAAWGLDSLCLIQLRSRLHSVLGLNLAAGALAEFPTVADLSLRLAEWIERERIEHKEAG